MISFLISVAIMSLPLTVMTQNVSPNQFLKDQGYTAFSEAVEKAGFLPLIDEALPMFRNRPLTAFVPNNAAFAAVKSTLDTLNQAQLQRVVAYHFAGTGIAASGIKNNLMVASLYPNNPLNFTVSGSTTSVNGATIVKTDIRLFTSYIHEINQVMIPANNPADAPLLVNVTSTSKATEPAKNSGSSLTSSQILMAGLSLLAFTSLMH